jgi:hypothetical protein
MPTIVYVLIAVAVGWFIGFLDSNLRTAKKIEAAESNAEARMKEAERKIAQLSQSSQTQQDDPGLLRLKKSDGRFTLEMDGAFITGELSSDKRKRLIELLTVFRHWLDGGQSSSAAPAVPIRDSTPLASDPAQVEVSRPAQSATKPLSPIKKPEAEKNISEMSMVQQIDTVLQARLADTSLDKRGIRLQESIQGGVEVYVGLQKFLAVEDVPDETIKAAIRAAIAAWENKYTPGM